MSINIKYFVPAVLWFFQSVKSFEGRMMTNAPCDLEHEPNLIKSKSFNCVYYDSNDYFEVPDLERVESFDENRNIVDKFHGQIESERAIECSGKAPNHDLDTESDSKSYLSYSTPSDACRASASLKKKAVVCIVKGSRALAHIYFAIAAKVQSFRGQIRADKASNQRPIPLKYNHKNKLTYFLH
ncbi:hypothetical protein BY996DRAFT_4111840 [Phakopsora pachyrhizi]|nr:hypothetical protein BY996DRAFT_4111840 [Phakopsora pachyrhizi]